MTHDDHNRTLGIMHLIYGGFQTLMLLFIGFFFIFVGGVVGSASGGDAAPIALFLMLLLFVLVLGALMSLPPLLAGYALLKHKPWARTAGIISAIVALLSFPFGTALGVYSLWFFFGEGKDYYKANLWRGARTTGALGESTSYTSTYGWDTQNSHTAKEGEAAYVPPTQPPDWRG